MITPQRFPNILLLIVAVAFLLRLAFVLSTDLSQVNKGGDTNWLLYAGKSLVDGTLTEPPQVGPVFLVYTGVIQTAFGPGITLPTEAEEPSIVKRFSRIGYTQNPSWRVFGLLNALMGAVLCAAVAGIGRRWFGPNIGLFAALIVALNPTFIIESGNILTETPFLLLLYGGLWLYGRATATDTPRTSAILVLVGVLLGLASLTRAVALLIPAVLMIDLFWQHRKRALRLVAFLFIGYALTLSTWTVYNLLRWNRFVIGGEGIIANVYIGTRPDGWTGAQNIDQQLGITAQGGDNQQKYAQGALTAITGDPFGYLRLRISNLLGALLQPHNTAWYPGESIKELIADWWARGHSAADLGRITSASYFWTKLILYLFHFFALIGGAFGLLIGLRRLGSRLALYGIVGYFLALHLVLTAIPRYLFPLEPLLFIFACFAVSVVFPAAPCVLCTVPSHLLDLLCDLLYNLI